MQCATCCRCYHASCLPDPGDRSVIDGTTFYCPSCRERQWDYDPPQIAGAASPASSAEMSSRNGGVKIGDLISSSPSTGTAVLSPESSDTGMRATLPSLSQSCRPRLDADQPPASSSGSPHKPNSNVLTPAGDHEGDITNTSRARSFLTEYGGFDPNREYRQELLFRLGWMFEKLESNEALSAEVRALREENSWLRRENWQLQNRLPSMETLLAGGPSGTTSPIPRPTSDTTGRTWDSIVMDLI